MKRFLIISLCLFFSGKAFSQAVCSAVKIETPVISKPSEAAIISATCSTLLIKWKGGIDQKYVINATFKDPVTNQATAASITDISCDFSQQCTATIPVASGTLVSWNLQSTELIDGQTFYSYPLRVDQDYLVPDCGQPVVKVEEQASAVQKADSNYIATGKESLVLSNDKLAMYPNPVGDVLNVKLSGDYTGNATISILDITGQQVKAINLNKQKPDYTDQITVSGLKPGIYYLNIKMKNGRSFTSRFIKN